MRWIPAFLIALGVTVTPASAEPLTPLLQVMEGDPEITYPFLRCAGFYQASTEWTGKDRAGPDIVAAIDQNIKNLLYVSILLRLKKSGGNPNEVSRVVLRDTRNIANLYLRRFENNYAETGHAWGKDELWLSDMEACKIVAERARR